MNLPFLTANEEGPKHLQLTVTPAVFAARPPAAPEPEAQHAEVEKEPPKKRGWWPFG